MTIGEVFGRTSTLSFKLKLSNGNAKKWDYIAVEHEECGLLLGQVIEITKQSGETIADCQIIGYRTERGFLRKPRTPIEPGTQASQASDEFIKNMLGLGTKGLYLGLLEGKSNLKAFLDPKRLLSKHLAVLAKSGAGKSYTVGVILEELLLLGVPVLILDPHGEYSSIKHPNAHADDKKYFSDYDITAKGFARNLREYSLNPHINTDSIQIKLQVPNEPFHLVDALPFKISSSQKGLLYNLVNDITSRKKQFSFRDLIKEIEFSESPAKWKLIGGFQALEKSGLYSFSPTSVNDLIKPGQLTIINFKGAAPESQEIVAQTVLATLFEQRKLNNLPPFFVILEEAHNFCPDRGFGETKSSRVIRTIASEGRKFGLGLCVISQRPARVDKSVLSQCTSQIAMQVTNPNDLTAIANSFEGVTNETVNEIKNLPTGKALVIGASDHPIFVDIRVRMSQHGGRSQTFNLSNNSIRRSQTVKSPVRQTEKNLLIFEPRLSKQDIKKMEKSNVKDIRLVLRPVLSLDCISSNKRSQLVVDMINFCVYRLSSKLEAIRIPKGLTTLSPIQKQILALVNKTGQTSVSEIFVKTGLSFGEVNGVVSTLTKQGLVTSDGKIISASKGSRLSLSNMHYIEKPKYSALGDGDILPPKISASMIINFIQSTGIRVEGKRQAYMPFYKIKSSDGIKTVDGMSSSLIIRS